MKTSWNGKERRKGTDWVDISINCLNIAAWIIFLIALIIFHYARPEFEYVYYKFFSESVSVRTHWLVELKSWLLLTLYFCVASSIATLVPNRFRIKRKTDRERYGMYMLVAVCSVFIGVILV